MQGLLDVALEVKNFSDKQGQDFGNPSVALAASLLAIAMREADKTNVHAENYRIVAKALGALVEMARKIDVAGNTALAARMNWNIYSAADGIIEGAQKQGGVGEPILNAMRNSGEIAANRSICCGYKIVKSYFAMAKDGLGNLLRASAPSKARRETGSRPQP